MEFMVHSQKVESGIKRDQCVQEVLYEQEDIVNRVAKRVFREEMIVWYVRKSARWWDNDKISHRHEVYK